MTKCDTTENSTSRVSKAVSATLAGVLAAGLVPVTALAADAQQDAAEDDGISTLASDSQTIYEATVKYKDTTDTFTVDGKTHGLKPVSVTPYQGEETEVTGLLPNTAGELEEGAYYYAYALIQAHDLDSVKNITGGAKYTDSDGNKQYVIGSFVKDANGKYTTPSTAGTYAVLVAQYDGDSLVWVKTADTFTIEAKSLADVDLFEKGNGTDDTTFNWDGGSLKATDIVKTIGVSDDGDDISDYVTVQLYVKGQSAALDGDDTILPGTDYVAKVTANNDADNPYAGADAVEVTFNLGKLNLSKAVISGVVSTEAPATEEDDLSLADLVATLNGTAGADLDADKISISFVKNPDGGSLGYTEGQEAKGAYTYKLSVAEDAEDYVEGSQEFQVYYVDYAADVDWSGVGVDVVDKAASVDLGAEDVDYFDTTKIKATYTDADDATKTIKNSALTIKVYDKDGNGATVADLKTPGKWTVEVSYLKQLADKTWVSAKDSVEVTVGYLTVTDDVNIFVAIDKTNVADGQTYDKLVYNGEDQTSAISTVVKTDTKTFTEDDDYTVTIKKDGKVVKSITDAGTYTYQVKGISFDDTLTITIKVQALEVTSFEVSNYDYDANELFAYTGETITPEFTFYNADGDEVNVPSTAYTVEYYKFDSDKLAFEKKASDLKEAGQYKAVFATADKETNYVVDIDSEDIDTYIEITEKKVFVDVPTTAWYNQYVYAANKAGYVYGLGNGNMYGPELDITRADVCVILARMAGVDLAQYTAVTTTDAFSDVASVQYYATSVAWAKSAGITTGYGDGTFRPTQSITREEFATMLYRYANLRENGAAVATDVETELAQYVDGAEVCDYAKNAIAWASENKIMNGYGDTKVLGSENNVTRAEVAKMVVTYQPDGVDKDIIADLS
jgi:hypothetical protein